MADGKVEFELVSPERLLMSEPVDMVVVPGAEGDFGVLPRHSLLISAVRRGVIQVWKNNAVNDRIFVAGGFCEVTAERCTVLAEEGVRVDDIDKNAVQAELKNLREDAADARTQDERSAVESRIAVREAMLEAAG